MALQQEPGKKTPMRPGIMTLDMASDFSLPDQSGGLDWTAAGTKLTLTELDKFMDDHSRMAIANGNVSLREAQYKLKYLAFLTNGSGTVEDCQIAITNSGGTTVHAVSPALTIPAGGSLVAELTFIVHQNTPGAVEYAFRASQTTAGTDITVESEYVGCVERIGNYNETGPA